MIHSTAIIEDNVTLGPNAKVWAFSQVRAGSTIGEQTTIGSHSYIDSGVRIGARCKLQTGTRLFHGVTVEDGVFIGPGSIITNDLRPRAINADRTIKAASDWTVTETTIKEGASLGAGSIVVAGAHIGSFALVGAGSTVVTPVPDHAIVVGSPARQIGWACHCGERLQETTEGWSCKQCHKTIHVPSE